MTIRPYGKNLLQHFLNNKVSILFGELFLFFNFTARLLSVASPVRIFIPEYRGDFTGIIMHTESIFIESTKKTPRIHLERGKILITGRSIPENPSDFYEPLYRWVAKYVCECNSNTDVILGFEFINTMSIKWVFTILRELGKTIDLPCYLRIFWYYERGDEDMCDLGHIIRTLVRCPFRVIEVPDIEKHDFSFEKLSL